MSQMSLLACLFLAGFLSTRYRILPASTSEVCNRLIITIALPALILKTIPSLMLDSLPWLTIAMPWIVIALISALVLLCAHHLKWSRQSTIVVLLLSTLGNTSFLGIPMVSILVGEAAVPIAILYDQFGSFVALSTLGLALCCLADNKAVSPATVLATLLRFPPFWALVFALLVPVHYPSTVAAFIAQLANMLLPLALLSVGAQFNPMVPRDDVKIVSVTLSLKLLLSPAIALLIVYWMGTSTLVAHTLVLEAAMAPMISAGILLLDAKIRPHVVSAILGWGIVLSFITVYLWSRLATALLN